MYEVGDSREVVIQFYADSPDIEAARQRIISNAQDEDIQVEILGMEYMQEVEVDLPQQPVGITGRSRHLLPRTRQ